VCWETYLNNTHSHIDMKEVRIPMDDKTHKQLSKNKNDRTWLEMLKDEAGIEE